MTSALEVIASGGAEQLASAVWQLLPPLGCIAGAGILFWLGMRRALRRAVRTPTEPNPVAEFWAHDGCPWCDTHDGTVCNCERPCASWICAAKAADRG